MDITDIKITTNHPKSVNNIPVAIIEGRAYGPDDNYKGIPVASYVIVNIDPTRPDHNDIMRFLSQSPSAYRRAEDAVKRYYNAPEPEVY